MTRSRQGKFCGGQPLLRLMRDSEDNGHLEEKIPISRVKSVTDCDVN